MPAEKELKLTNLRETITSSQPKKKKIPDHITQLTPSEDAREIKYFPRISKRIKDNFRNRGQEICDIKDLKKDGPTGSGAETGKKWHTSIKKYLDDPEKNKDEIGKVVIDAVKELLPEIEFLQTNFPLYGYMMDNDDEEEIFFWSGKVDAIGWIEDNYVIVDWKAVNLLNFWEKNRDAYGSYLHQCLVYAQLLMTHLNLTKLPYILIVPICNISGQQIRPALFRNFPKECIDELSKYAWSAEEPRKERRLSLSRTKVENIMKDTLTGKVKKENLNETVNELLKALGFEK